MRWHRKVYRKLLNRVCSNLEEEQQVVDDAGQGTSESEGEPFCPPPQKRKSKDFFEDYLSRKEAREDQKVRQREEKDEPGPSHEKAAFRAANHIVERIWPEVNNRVNYPLKTTLLGLVDQEEICMNDSLVRYCVSNLTGCLCEIGLTRLVESWNAHRIPGRGIPNDLAGRGCPKKIQQELLPHSAEAADLYSQQLGSSLTRHSTFGVDPFSTEQDKITVENQFAEQYSDISDLYS
ncbi:unnamed protein product [Leuciscus chuanchicus]